MTSAVQILQQQIESLSGAANEERRKSEIAAVAAESAIRNAEMLQNQVKALQDALRIIQRQVAAESGVAATGPQLQPKSSGNSDKLSPTDAILRYFDTHSQGTFSDVIDAVEFTIKTESSKPRQIIRNTMAAMEKSGKLRREGTMFFAVKPIGLSSLSGLRLGEISPVENKTA